MSMDALVVAPHPDDAELGMGGTIAEACSGEEELDRGHPRSHERRADTAGQP